MIQSRASRTDRRVSSSSSFVMDARAMARKTLDRARAAGTLIACAPRVVSPKTCDLIESTFPASSHDRAELLSRLIALGLLQYAQHMARYRALRHSA